MDDDWDAAVAAALAPYDWRGLTDRMMARMVLAAADRQSVVRFLLAVPGTRVGALPPLEPAPAGDERVQVLVRALSGRPWRTWQLGRVCAELRRALESWQRSRPLLASDVRRLLGGR